MLVARVTAEQHYRHLCSVLRGTMPFSSELALGILLRIQLIVERAALAFLAWTVRSA